MPRVPLAQEGQNPAQIVRAESRLIQPTTRPLLSNSASILAQGASNLVNQVFDFSLHANEINNKTKAKDLWQQYVTAENDLLFNEEEGFYAKKGQGAFSSTKRTLQSLEKLKREIAGGAENEQQQQLFSDAIFSRMEQAKNGINRHSLREHNVWQNELSQSVIANSINDATNYYNDPAKIAASRDTAINEIMESGARAGWPHERIQAERKKIISDVHSSVLSKMNVTDPHGAEQYFEQNKHEIDPERRLLFEDNIKKRVLVSKAQDFTDKLMTARLSESQSFAEARKRLSGKEEDEVIKRLKWRFQEQKRAVTQAKEDIFDRQFKNIMGGQDYIEDSAMMTPRQVVSLNRILESRKSGKAIQTDWGLYQSMVDMATSSDPAERKRFAHDEGITDTFGSLAPSERNKIINLRKQLRQDDNNAINSDEFTLINTTKELLSNSLKEIGVNPNPSIDKESEKAQVMAELRRRIDSDISEAGIGKKDADKIEKTQSIIDRHLMEVVTDKGFIFDSKRRVFDLKVEGVPDDQIDEISAILVRFGKEVNKENILKVWRGE
jgi:hypothetical protein